MGKDTQSKTILTREFSAGGIVFKHIDGQVFWIIRKTAPSSLYPKTYWMLAKGRIDDTKDDLPGPMSKGLIRADEMSLENTAIREVKEEAGVEAKIISKISTIKYVFTDPNRGRIMKFVTFYLMEWIRDLPEGFDKETSEVSWLSFDEAYKKLSFSAEKGMLKKANELLGQQQIAPVA